VAQPFMFGNICVDLIQQRDELTQSQWAGGSPGRILYSVSYSSTRV
jgi:hypothetical protein